MRTWPATNLLIRLDPRARGALQQQIYAGIRRAILDGVVAPGTRLPSSRAVAEDLRVSRTTAVLALGAAPGRGISGHSAGVGHLRGAGSPGRPAAGPGAPSDAEPAAPAAVAPGDRPGGAADGRPAARRPPAAVPHRDAGARPVPGPALGAARDTARARHHVGAARLRRAGRTARAPRGHRRPRPGGARDAVRSRSGGDRRGRPAGPRSRLPPPARPGRPGLDGGPGYPGARSALVGAGARILPVRVDAEGLDVDAGVRGGGDGRLVYVTPSHQYPLGVPMSLPRRLALLKWATPRAGVGARGRLRQRVPVRGATDPVPPRARRRRPGDLRRQLQQDPLPGPAPRLRDRAARPPGPAGRRARRGRPAPARARPDRPDRLHRRRALRATPAPHAGPVPGAPGGGERRGDALLPGRPPAAPGPDRPPRRGRPRPAPTPPRCRARRRRAAWR